MTESWEHTIASSKRVYGVACVNITSGQSIKFQQYKSFESASTIKLFILLAALRKIQDKELSLYQSIKIGRADIGKNGSGVLRYFYLNKPFTLYNLLVLMIIVSDNVATNILIKLLGQQVINDYISGLGLQHTHLVSDKLDFPNSYSTSSKPLGTTTAEETLTTIRELVDGKLLNSQLTKMAIKILSETQGSTFGRLIPDKIIKRLGNKTGAIWYESEGKVLLADCGFIFTSNQQTIIFSLFSMGPMDKKILYGPDSFQKQEFAKIAVQLFDELHVPAMAVKHPV